MTARKNSSENIVRAAIHPSIGIVRVGNSEHEYFIGPEVIEPVPHPPGFYRDRSGALKRQAARFRIYGLNAQGEAVKELTASNADIRWTVHLANKKAAWYQFQIALDIPEAASAPPTQLRNITIGDRSRLVIDPGPRHIKGRDVQGGHAHSFDTGRFMDKPVYLGEIRTDKEGHLLVLGGRGNSASYNGSRALTFANNDGWHDDVSDGPVTAEVQLQGRKLQVDPAWVVVAPPNYAPLQKSVRTMWDLMRDVAIQAVMMKAPSRPSFEQDIRPVFERLSHLQWVNKGFAAAFGCNGPYNLASPEWLHRLSHNADTDQEMRRVIENQFRRFDTDSWSPKPWPWIYGDATSIPTAPSPRAHLALTDTQLHMLKQWAAGDFDADYDPNRHPPLDIESIPLKEQPSMLDRASLEFCLADAFHPGCEMTWPVRNPGLYMSAFRIAHAPAGWIEPSYGWQFNMSTIPSWSPPFAGQQAGGLTRWMAVPWQTDTGSCQSGYTKAYDPYLPTFWPAHVPNQVLAQEDYEVVMDSQLPLAERLSAFARRASWIRPLGTKNSIDQINNLVADISQVGVVEHREGPKDRQYFPAVMQVENLTKAVRERLAVANEDPNAADQLDLTGTEKMRRFPHGLVRY